jgi:tRNA pseudouridine55 synthase
LTLRVLCSRGTYIRALARDIGRDLGCGALVDSLKRTRVGTYSLDDAWPLPALVEAIKEQRRSDDRL